MAEDHLVELGNLQLQVEALQPQPLATTERRIRKYLTRRGQDTSRYVEGFHIDLEQQRGD